MSESITNLLWSQYDEVIIYGSKTSQHSEETILNKLNLERIIQ